MRRYQISLTEGPAKWTGRLMSSDHIDPVPICHFTSGEFDRKGQAHQAVIDYCLSQKLDHQTMPIEIVRWEGC